MGVVLKKMKTITEMQAELRDISLRINNLTKELSEYNQFNSNEIVIDFNRLYSLGIRNPIKGHMLARSSEGIKKQYITLLISLLYLSDANQEKGWLLIQRIVCGIGMIEKLDNLATDGLKLTGQLVDKFTTDIISTKLTNSLVVDSMLVYLCCEHKNKRMLKYMSGIFELVNCGKTEILEILEITKIIATQDKRAYKKLQTKKLQTNKMAYSCYLKDLR